MSGNSPYSNNFPSDWVAQRDEDAEPSRPSTPIQPPEQTPLPASSLTPSSGAATTSSQYSAYFPDSWIASPSSSPSPSSSRTSVTPTRLQSRSSIVPQKPWNRANVSTSPSLSPSHIPPGSVITPRSSLHLSQTTLRSHSSIPSTARTRNTSWANQPQPHDSIVRQNHADWTTTLANSVTVQLSPLLEQKRPGSQERKNTTRQSQHTDRRSVPSWMQLQRDLEDLDLDYTKCKVDHDINDKVDYVEGIGEDDSDEGYGDIPYRAPFGSIAYSAGAPSIQ